MATATHTSEKHLIGVAYSFRGYSIYHHVGHSGMQADVVLEG